MCTRLKRTLVMILMVIMAVQTCCIETALAVEEIKIYLYGDFVPGKGVIIFWDSVSGIDHYDCTVLNQTTGIRPRERSKVTGDREVSISGSKITVGDYKVFVGGVDANGNDIAVGYAYFTVSEEDDCNHSWNASTGKCTKCGKKCSHYNTYETCYKETEKVSLIHSTDLLFTTTSYAKRADTLSKRM